MKLSRSTVVWLIPTLLTVHNAEEAFAFRRALASLSGTVAEPFATLAARLNPAAVVQALAVLSLVAFILAAIVTARPTSRSALWLLLSLEAAVGLNVVAHLASAAFVFHGYGPGLATAVLLNAPFLVYCMRRARHERWLTPIALRATLPAALVLHGPVLLGVLWLAARLDG